MNIDSKRTEMDVLQESLWKTITCEIRILNVVINGVLSIYNIKIGEEK